MHDSLERGTRLEVYVTGVGAGVRGPHRGDLKHVTIFGARAQQPVAAGGPASLAVLAEVATAGAK